MSPAEATLRLVVRLGEARIDVDAVDEWRGRAFFCRPHQDRLIKCFAVGSFFDLPAARVVLQVGVLWPKPFALEIVQCAMVEIDQRFWMCRDVFGPPLEILDKLIGDCWIAEQVTTDRSRPMPRAPWDRT